MITLFLPILTSTTGDLDIDLNIRIDGLLSTFHWL